MTGKPTEYPMHCAYARIWREPTGAWTGTLDAGNRRYRLRTHWREFAAIQEARRLAATVNQERSA